jgi:hypothetical protein
VRVQTLQMLARYPNGYLKALMLAHGFKVAYAKQLPEEFCEIAQTVALR